MSRLPDDVRELAERIGPRGTGTSAERAAADFVAARLAALGLPVARSSFRAVRSQNAFPLASVALALVAVAAYPLGPGGRWAAAALALATAPLLWRAIRLSTSPVRTLLPKVPSGNVVATVAPRGPAAARVVVLAHLDTNRMRLAWRSGGVRWLEPLTWLTLAVFGALGVAYLGGAVLGAAGDGAAAPWWPPADAAGWLWWASLVPAAYVAGMLVTLVRDDLTPYSPGAHDNAASVSVALDVARRLAAAPLDATEVVLAFTGAEETDHAGLHDLLRADRARLREAAFLGLEGLGSGELVYLTRHGLCDHVRADPGLLTLLGRVAERRPELGAAPAEMTEEDEVTNLRRLGYRAVCIAGRDGATGTIPHWHRPDDTADTVSPGFMERAAAFVHAALEDIDATARPAGTGEETGVTADEKERLTCARS